MGEKYTAPRGFPVSSMTSGGGPGGGDVTLKGTDGSKDTNDQFEFKSGADSNVVVHVDANATWPKLEVHVYYV